MARYAYEALSAAGRSVSGVEEAASSAAAERRLRERGLRPLALEPASAGGEAAREGLRFRRRRAEVAGAFRYLATLLEADFPLDRALGTVRELTGRADVATGIGELRARVRAGSALSDALAERPDLFPRLAFGMARAGERGGFLGRSLARLADHLEREEELRGRVVSALLYPAIMAVVGGAAVLVLVFAVLPRFVTILGEAGAEVPRTTALLLGTSAFLIRWWPALLVGAVVAGAASAAWLRSEAGRLATARALLAVPVLGPLRRRLSAARFGRSLATLLESGLPILPALEASADSLADPAVSGRIREARERIRAGGSLGDALRGAGVFPTLFVQMTSVGEEGGRLPEMLDRAAKVAEEELERGMERLVRLVEPALVVTFGAVVAFVALSLLQAIYGIRLKVF